MIAFLYGTSHHRELGGNDPFEASTIAPEIRVLRQVVNWHKKKKIIIIWRPFGKLPVFALSLFGCGFCCYSFFGGLGFFFFPFDLVGEFSPPVSHPGLDFATRSLGFFFSHRPPTLVPRREFGCCCCVFWFCKFFGNRDEEGRGDGRGQQCVSRGGWGETQSQQICFVCVHFLNRKVNQKSSGEWWSQSPGKIRSFAPSLSSRLLSKNYYV